MHRAEQSIQNPINVFNSHIAGKPIAEADILFAKLHTKLILQGDAQIAEILERRKILVRNKIAENISDGKTRNVTLTEIIQKSTLEEFQKLSIFKIIKWRKQIWEEIFLNCKLMNMNQKELLKFEGVKYFPDGTIDLAPFAFNGIIINAKNNLFSINDGELNRKSDKKYAKKQLKLDGIEMPSDSHFHHQIIDGQKQLVLVSKSLHLGLPHIGWSRYERIENLNACIKQK